MIAMTTMQEDPLAPASAQFALIKPAQGITSAAKDTAAAAPWLCPRGLRQTTPTPVVPELPEHHFDHHLQITIGSDGRALIDTVPWYMAAKSWSNTDGQEDWSTA